MKANPSMHLVVEEHKNTFHEPIRLEEGERLELSGKSDNWFGHIWLWANASSGGEGWVPSDLPVKFQGETTARYQYDAKELDVAIGCRVEIHTRNHGWAWCENQHGECGWVPENVLNLSDNIKGNK